MLILRVLEPIFDPFNSKACLKLRSFKQITKATPRKSPYYAKLYNSLLLSNFIPATLTRLSYKKSLTYLYEKFNGSPPI
jgi:hypothetical protein